MKKITRKTAQLGDLIAAVFDEAARYSTEPSEVSCLAAQAVKDMMRRARKMAVLPAASA